MARHLDIPRKWIMKFAKSALRLDWIAHAADRLDAELSPQRLKQKLFGCNLIKTSP